MPTRLIALGGGPDIVVEDSPFVVGRYPRCDARLEGQGVSRHHCSLIEQAGAVMVYDLASTNGTYINGEKAESGQLRPGDVLAIGPFQYRVGPSILVRSVREAKTESCRPADPQGSRPEPAPMLYRPDAG